MKEAGVALQTFYRLFAGKDQLLLAVFEDLIAEQLRAVRGSSPRRSPTRSTRLHFYITEALHVARRRRRRATSRPGSSPPSTGGCTSSSRRRWPARRNPSPTSWPRQLELAAADGLLAPADPQRDAWFVAKLVMAVFHHYAFSDGELDTEEIGEQLWRFCRTALGVEEAHGSTVSTTVEIPESIDELLSPGWLTAALSARFPGVQVETVTRGPVVERVSTNARFKIEGDLPDGLPPALSPRATSAPVGRGSRNAGVPEARFYRDLAHATGVRTLNSVWADVDPSTEHGVVITEDVVEAGGVFCDALDPCTVDRTAETLEQFALLHAFAWEDARLAESSWLTPRLAWILHVRGITEISANFDGPNGAGVPDGTRDAQGLIDAYGPCRRGLRAPAGRSCTVTRTSATRSSTAMVDPGCSTGR